MTAQQSVSDSFGSALELAQKVRSREVSAVEVTRSYLQRIRRFDEALGCFLCVDEKGVLVVA